MQSKIDSRLKGFDHFVKRRMKDWNVPGVAVGVVQGKRIIYIKCFGLRDLKNRLPITEQTLFGIGSCTKAFTATAIGILVDEGKLDWDKPIRDYIPWFKMYDPVATKRLTIRDFLTHRSGLPGHGFTKRNQSVTRREMVRRLRYLEPSADFRSKHVYCNLGYGLLGFLVEVVTNKTWEQFVKERIFKPLGMSASRFLIDLPSDEMAIGYTQIRKKLVPELSIFPKGTDIATVTGRACGPSGAIVSNVLDMCHWIIAQLNNGKYGKQQVISEQSLKEIHKPQVVLPEWDSTCKAVLDASYCMGWVVRAYRGYRLLQHGGNGIGFNARVMFLPNEHLGAVILTNITDSPLNYIIPLNIFDRLLDLKPFPWNLRAKRYSRKGETKIKREKIDRERKRGTYPSLPLEQYTGDYWHPGYGRLTVVIEDNKMKIQLNRLTYPLKHYENDIFQMVKLRGHWWLPKLKVTFQINKTGNIESVSIPLVIGAPKINIVFKK